MRSPKKLHILFVDDDESMMSVSTGMLERLGHTVRRQNESLNALRLFSEDPDEFDLAIVDHQLPDLNGLELGERFRRIRPGFPVMLYAGSIDPPTLERIEAAGIHHVIIEPLTVSGLEKALYAALQT